MSEKLKPCPWCGGAPEVAEYDDDWESWNQFVSWGIKGCSWVELRLDDGFWVQCSGKSDGHLIVSPIRKTKAGAIKAWNERRVR